MYGDITIQLAKTAATYIHADSIPYWLKHGTDEEWEETNKKLDILTNTSDLAYIYVSVISPDYKQRTYVFDTVNKSYCSDIMYKAYRKVGINLNKDGFATTIYDLISSSDCYISYYHVYKDDVKYIYYLD
jgi:hypothetical protein